MMQQLLLDIAPDTAQTLARFVRTGNDEAWQAICHLADGAPAEPLIYLWGPSGSGKSHLLKAAATHMLAHGRPASYWDAGVPAHPESGLLCIDNAGQLDADSQRQLFSLINAARDGQIQLLVAGDMPPGRLGLRDDVTSRLGWHLVFQLHVLTDEAKQSALQARAEQMGFQLDIPIIHYLMSHWRRDLPSLIWLLEELDRHSLVRQRPVTLPLLREVLQLHQTISDT